MHILALDSSAVTGTVALCDDEAVLGSFTITNGNTHSETLLPMVEQLLKLYDMSVQEIDLFACTSGPGSFTGVRIGVSTIKGLAFGTSKPCVGVSSLEALAENMRGFEGLICPVMNARRSQVYNALFLAHDGLLERIEEDRMLSIAELEEDLLQRGYTEVTLVGDGAGITKDGFQTVKVRSIAPELEQPSGVSVARVAYHTYQTGEYDTDVSLHPIYLRLPQAERERLEKLNAEAQKALQNK